MYRCTYFHPTLQSFNVPYHGLLHVATGQLVTVHASEMGMALQVPFSSTYHTTTTTTIRKRVFS